MRVRRSRSAAVSSPVASIGSCGNPIERENTFALPPGTMPKAGTSGPGPSSPSIPLMISFAVPSPPRAMTASTPSRRALAPSSAAWPRWSVVIVSRWNWYVNELIRTSRARGVVVVAFGLTTNSPRMRAAYSFG